MVLMSRTTKIFFQWSLPLVLVLLLMAPQRTQGQMAVLELIADKVGDVIATKFKDKMGDIFKRPCNCQLVMNPPPPPWYHRRRKKSEPKDQPGQQVTSPGASPR
jgi:hypothetical protein